MRRALLAAALVLGVAATQAAPGPGSAVVERLHAVLAENMAAAAERGFDARVEALEAVVSEVFDFATIARVAMGRHWDALDADGRERLMELLRRESVLTYAERFAGDGAHLRIDAEQPARGGRLLVRSTLVPGDGDPVSLDYVLQEADGRWRIVNVLAEGVSDLSLKRAQYAAVIRDEGIATLLDRLAGQVAEQARRGASGS